nr:histidinol-phosphate transaminase [Desulfobacterales bacterium]
MNVPDSISSLRAYQPGKPTEELEREYGISNSIKLASNENPLGPSPCAIEAISKSLKNLHRYPDGNSYNLRKRLAEHLNVPFNQIVLGNGSNEIIELLVRTFLCPGEEVIIPAPSFLMYKIMVQAASGVPVEVPLTKYVLDLDGMLKRITSKTRMIFINNPNNPTGTIVKRREMEQFLEEVPNDVIVIIDEAYIEFVRDPDCPRGLEYVDGQNMVVTLRTFSKVYGLAGLRIGYGVMKEEVSEFINRVRQPFNTNTLAQIGALAALDDRAFFEETIRLVHEGLDFLYHELDRMGVRYLPTEANFLLIDLGRDSEQVYREMLKRGVIIRSMTPYGYPNCIRITVGRYEENLRFIETLKEVLQV